MTGQKDRACQEWLQYAGILYYAVDGHGHKFQPQLGELIHWLHYHLTGSNPPPALYHLEMLLQSLEYLRGGRHYLYNSIYEITRLEAYPRSEERRVG